jgi:membrane-associated protease RseP (regulator of RpoE activity)
MRIWPSRQRPAAALPSAEDLLITEDLLRRSVEDVLAVRERQIHGAVIAYRGQLQLAPARARELLQARFRPFGFTPFLREDGRGEVVVQAVPLAETTEPQRVGVNVLLFVLTCLSTLIAGAGYAGSPTFDAFRSSITGTLFISGVPFAATLMAILVVHEFGHYFSARYYRASVSLPYFIPAPPPFPFGTLGAIIRMRSPARDRNALFDIAAAGPLAGLLVAIPAFVLGLQWSNVVPVPAVTYEAFGQSGLTQLLVYLRFGSLPEGTMVYTHPMADAAWVGFFVTALNLFPVGQLDGGRIAYALFGRYHALIGKITIIGTVLLGLAAMAVNVLVWGGTFAASLNWFVWAALVFFLVGVHHGPPVDEVSPLSPDRRVVGVVCLILFVLLIPPIPIHVR